MADLASICRVYIARSESDEYSTDLSFSFVAADGRTRSVHGICAAPDIFEIKAHTLAKILAGTITLPRTLDFGFARGEGPHVHFTFEAGADRLVALRCSASGHAVGPSDEEELVFVVRDEASLAQLLTVFRHLAGAVNASCAWHPGGAGR